MHSKENGQWRKESVVRVYRFSITNGKCRLDAGYHMRGVVKMIMLIAKIAGVGAAS